MKYTDLSFLETLKPYVLADMKSSGILASLTASQAFIESSSGNSALSRPPYNNLFGIKGSYNGNSVKMWTTEYINGVAQRVLANFRVYPSWQESVNDHSAMFNRMKQYENLRGLNDYRLACKYVKADGYASSPSYEQTLLTCINKYSLFVWDAEVLGSSPGPTPVKALPVLKLGSRSEYVKAWQNFLNLNGYFCGKADGIFGKATEAAVKEWQAAHLETCGQADGIIGRKTWASIGLQ